MKFVNIPAASDADEDQLIDFDASSAKQKTRQEFIDDFKDIEHIFPAKAKNPRYGEKTEEELKADQEAKEVKLGEVYDALVPKGKVDEPEVEPLKKAPKKKPEPEVAPDPQVI